VVISDTFDGIIMGVIVLNIVCLAVVYVDMPAYLTAILFWLNIAFTSIFLLEAGAKMYAVGVGPYFRDRWCLFDFVVAALSLIQIIADALIESNIPAVNLLRVFRVVRIFRLVPKVRAQAKRNGMIPQSTYTAGSVHIAASKNDRV
jgi:hypothetical protein